VLRRLMTGRQREGAFNSEELIEIMDTCFNCKLCHSDCPSGVNIPKIVQEAKARYHQSHGLSCDKWMLTQSEKMLRAGMWITPLANTLTAVSPFRRLLELMTGIDHRRALPKLKKWRIRRRYTPSPQSGRPNVVLYVDLAKYIAPEVIQSAVDVLEHNGFEVEIPDVPWCNMPALSEGAVMQAREHVTKVAELLAPYAFKGTPILALDSTACLALQQEFLTYVDTPQTRAVSRHTREIIDFLVELKNTRKLKVDFKRVDMAVAYHQPCHHKALGIGAPSAQLLKQIPGLHLNIVDQGCCGNPAGWGMMAKNYEESMWIGKNVFKECASKRLDCAVSESNCCRSQIEHGSGKKSLHPIQIVAQAYGYEVAQPREEGLDKLDLPEKKSHHDDHAHIHVEPPKPAMSHGHAHDAHTQVLTKDSAHH
jgi:Fe-S oxidoreductase